MNNTHLINLTPRHFKILDLALAGWTNKNIAAHFEMSQTQVSIVINSPMFQHQFAMRRSNLEEQMDSKSVEHLDEATLELKKNATLAAKKLVKSLESQNELIVLKSANDILDRTGHSRVLKENKVITNVNISEDDSKRIVDALLLDKEI